MTARNYDDVLNQIRAAGIHIDSLVTDGTKQRYRTDETPRDKAGWTILHAAHSSIDGAPIIMGAFGIWRGNDPCTQKVSLSQCDRPTAEQAEEFKRLQAATLRNHRERRANEARAAAAKAAGHWAEFQPEGESPYLRAKGVGGHGVRYENGEVAVVALRDAKHGRIQALQYLRSRGQAERRGEGTPTKQIWPQGAAKQGHFHLLGPDPLAVGWLAIAEGYATAASIHEATGGPVAMAVDAGNLEHVARALRDKYQGKVRIILAADDDRWQRCISCKTPMDLHEVEGAHCPHCGELHKSKNAGITTAKVAAAEVSGRLAAPSFADPAGLFQLYQSDGEKVTDWNDLAQREGLEVVRAQWADHLLAADVRPAAVSAASKPATAADVAVNFQDVEELLNRYALIYNHGSTVFDRRKGAIVALSDLRDACADGKLVRAWQASPQREVVEAEEVGFDPTERDHKIRCNLYKGWPTQPADLPPADASERCRHLRQGLLWLCSNDGELYDWVLRWLALPIQKPGTKMKTAIVVHGPQGSGKSTFFEAIAKIYGPYSRVLNQDAMEDKHNDWASRMLFAIADEVVARSEVWHVKNKLKGLITGDTIRINPKHMRAYDEKNHVNMVFLSNEIQPVALDRDDRRHCVIWTPPKLEKWFYDRMHEEIENGGIAALHRHLLELPLADFRASTEPPMNTSKRDLIELSMDTVCAFAQELEEGRILARKPVAMRVEDAYRLYGSWCNQQAVKPTNLPRFSLTLNKKHGIQRTRARWRDANQQMRNSSALLVWSAENPPTENLAEWYGRHILDSVRLVEDALGSRE
jgi:putative DNA primase/helicase